ncbi:Uncharacterised protein [Mycobacterium tuberculosis]|nr:Uncharacterised protein [Mycobacterium tuberculosis]
MRSSRISSIARRKRMRQLPHPGEQPFRRTLADQHLAGMLTGTLDQCCVSVLRTRWLRLLLDRERALHSGGSSRAVRHHRTSQAVRRFGRANQRAELHERLVEVPGCPIRDQLLCQLLHKHAGAAFHDILFNEKIARQHAHDIAVYRSLRFIVGNAENRSGRIRPHALQREYGLLRIRHGTPVALLHFPYSSLEIAGTRIISEPFPRLEHLFFRRFR